MVYDKTSFKPEELTTLGRYKFSFVDTGETSGQSDASTSEATDSSSDDSEETSEAPSQFDLGDFSNMKPAEEAAPAGQEDELPLLGGPDIDQ